jgi:hypothetical protein
MALHFSRHSTGSAHHPSPQGEPVSITCHASSDAIKVVGITQALDGNMVAQLQVLQDKAHTWGAQIC